MKFLLSLMICLMAGNLLADGPMLVKNPIELTSLVSVPKEIEGLQWNRWTSENFTVLCLNNKQAEYLYKHLELVKTWVYSRWGFPDVDFAIDCKIVVVDDPILYEKLFRLKKSKAEIGRDVIFVLANDSPSHTIPIPLSEVCFAQFAERYNVEFGCWAYRGMSLLDGSLEQIRSDAQSMKSFLDANKPLYFSQGLLETSREGYDKLDDGKKFLYDKNAMIFCLMIRKEFGQEKFHEFLKVSSNPQKALKDVLGFDSYDQFDKTFKRYLIDLTNDIEAGNTPDSYLQINAK